MKFGRHSSILSLIYIVLLTLSPANAQTFGTSVSAGTFTPGEPGVTILGNGTAFLNAADPIVSEVFVAPVYFFVQPSTGCFPCRAVQSAGARADLRSGELGASVIAGVGGDGSASAILNDTLSFDLPDGMTSAVVNIRGTVDGSYQDRGLADASFQMLANGFGDLFNVYNRYGDRYGGFQGNAGGQSFGNPSDTSFLYNTESGFSVNVRVYEGVFYSINSALLASYRADYSHTSRWVFDNLPVGISFKSASGKFLAANTVPEPHEWALFIAGFTIIGCSLRLRKARTVFGHDVWYFRYIRV